MILKDETVKCQKNFFDHDNIKNKKITQTLTTLQYLQSSDNVVSECHIQIVSSEDESQSSNKAKSRTPKPAEYSSNYFLLIKEKNQSWNFFFVNKNKLPSKVSIDIIPGLATALTNLPNLPPEKLTDEHKNEINNLIKAFSRSDKYYSFMIYHNFLCSYETPIDRYMAFLLGKNILELDTIIDILEQIDETFQPTTMGEACGKLLLANLCTPNAIEELINSLEQKPSYENEVTNLEMYGMNREPPLFFRLVSALKNSEFLAPGSFKLIDKYTMLAFIPIKKALEEFLIKKKLFGKDVDPKKIEEFMDNLSASIIQKDPDLQKLLSKLREANLKYFEAAVRRAANFPAIVIPMKSTLNSHFNVILKIFCNDKKIPKIQIGQDFYFVAEYIFEGTKKRILMRIQLEEKTKLQQVETILFEKLPYENIHTYDVILHENKYYLIAEAIKSGVSTIIVAQLFQDNKGATQLKEINEDGLKHILRQIFNEQKETNVFVIPSFYYSKYKSVVPYMFLQQICHALNHVTLSTKIIPKYTDKYLEKLNEQWPASSSFFARTFGRKDKSDSNATIARWLTAILRAVLANPTNSGASEFPRKYGEAYPSELSKEQELHKMSLVLDPSSAELLARDPSSTEPLWPAAAQAPRFIRDLCLISNFAGNKDMLDWLASSMAACCPSSQSPDKEKKNKEDLQESKEEEIQRASWEEKEKSSLEEVDEITLEEEKLNEDHNLNLEKIAEYYYELLDLIKQLKASEMPSVKFFQWAMYKMMDAGLPTKSLYKHIKNQMKEEEKKHEPEKLDINTILTSRLPYIEYYPKGMKLSLIQLAAINADRQFFTDDLKQYHPGGLFPNKKLEITKETIRNQLEAVVALIPEGEFLEWLTKKYKLTQGSREKNIEFPTPPNEDKNYDLRINTDEKSTRTL